MKHVLKGIIFVVIIFLLIPLGSSEVGAKDYSLPSLQIQAQINRDGSIDITEERVFSFEGSYSWAQIIIPESITRQGFAYQTQITDFKVSEGTEVLPTDIKREDGNFIAKWYYSAYNEEKTFLLQYTLLNAITEYPDIAEFYWQAISDSNDKGFEQIKISVNVPEPVSDKEQLKVFMHGPLSGYSSIVDTQTVSFTATRVPAEQYVEIRVLFPHNIVNGIHSERYTLSTILEEEREFVEQTIAYVKRQQLIRNIVILVLLIWIPLSLIIWLVCWYLKWKVVGKDYRSIDVPEYQFDLPSDLPPALVQSLLNQGGKPSTTAFTATIFDLARRGYLELDSRAKVKSGLLRTKTVYQNRLRLKREPDSLRDYEEQVWDFLFKRAGGINQWLEVDKLKDWIKQNSSRFQSFYKDWQKEVKSESSDYGFMEDEGDRAVKQMWIIAVILALGIVNFLLIILAAIINPYLKRRKPEWQDQADHWLAFKTFLDRFSKFERLPPEAYKLWEYYLVFGILFGKAREIIKMLPIILKNEEAVQATWITGAGIESGMMDVDSVSSLTASINSFDSALTSVSHYSSGSGGGASFGGGGGSGGSSVSAG